MMSQEGKNQKRRVKCQLGFYPVCVCGGGGGDMGKGFHSKKFPTSANYYREGPTRVSKMV